MQGQFVTVTTSPAVAGYSHSLNVSVVATGHSVVSAVTTMTVAGPVTFQYVQLLGGAVKLPPTREDGGGGAATVVVVVNDDDEMLLVAEEEGGNEDVMVVVSDDAAGTVVVEAEAGTAVMDEDCAMAPAARRPTIAKVFFILEYITACLLARWC